jgi:uncharacterized protein YukE
VATLDEAADALAVKLQGLDSEIEASEHSLEELRGRIDAATHEVEQEWTGLTEAVSSFLQKVHDEQERLAHQAQETLPATTDAQHALATTGTEARAQIAEGRANLEGLAQHAGGLVPIVESLGKDSGEAPAKSLAERAAQIEQELTQAVDEASHFLRDELVPEIEQAGQEMRERAQALHDALTDEYLASLQTTFDDWESKVDELEAYVAGEGFKTSHEHAQAVVEYAMEECQTAFTHQLDELRQLVQTMAGEVHELVAETQRAAETIVDHGGAELVVGLDTTRQAVDKAATALGTARDLLVSHRFMEA